MIKISYKIADVISILEPLDYSIDNISSIEYITTIDDIIDNSMIFMKEITLEQSDLINSFKNVLVITQKKCDNLINYIKVDNTRLSMAKILDNIEQLKNKYNDNYIYISSSSKIDKSVIIEPFVYVGDNVTIEPNTIVKSGAKIMGNCHIGKNCIIRENSVVSGQGFGVEKDDQGNNFKIRHFGGVIIGDYVEIGALNTIVSGTLKPTVISDYTKIDDHVHIAHNCHIGKNCIITAGVILSGSVAIEDNTWVGPNSTIKNGLRISENSLIGIGSVVTKDLLDSGKTYAGNPATEFRKYIEEKRKMEYLTENVEKIKSTIEGK